jgi:hypothetical protein
MSTNIDTIYVKETLCPPRPVIRQSTTATGAA